MSTRDQDGPTRMQTVRVYGGLVLEFAKSHPVLAVTCSLIALSLAPVQEVLLPHLYGQIVTAISAKGAKRARAWVAPTVMTICTLVGAQALWLLRLPAALPFLFPALRVGIAAGLVGAMVAELPTGAQAGLGARLLTGSYYGNTVQIWSALVMSALLGLTLTTAVAGIERLALRHRNQG